MKATHKLTSQRHRTAAYEIRIDGEEVFFRLQGRTLWEEWNITAFNFFMQFSENPRWKLVKLKSFKGN